MWHIVFFKTFHCQSISQPLVIKTPFSTGTSLKRWSSIIQHPKPTFNITRLITIYVLKDNLQINVSTAILTIPSNFTPLQVSLNTPAPLLFLYTFYCELWIPVMFSFHYYPLYYFSIIFFPADQNLVWQERTLLKRRNEWVSTETSFSG